MIKEKLLKKEISKEKIVKIISIIISLLLIMGCSNKYSSDIFIKDMKKKNFSVVDLSDENNKMVLAVGNHYQVYFYEYNNYKEAKKNLNKNTKEYKTVHKEEKNNKEIYIIENDNIYTKYVLKNNTYIYISGTTKYKNEINRLLSDINY